MMKTLGIALCAALTTGILGSAVLERPTPAQAPAFGPSNAQIEAARQSVRYLTRAHLKPVELNQAFGSQVFTTFIDSLDTGRWFFTQADLDEFADLRANLAEELRKAELATGYRIFARYTERVAERVDFARALVAKGVALNTDRTLVVDRRKEPFAADRSALDELWTLRVADDWIRLKLNGRDDAKIRESLDRRYADIGKRVAELNGDDVFQYYVNAFASAIEPHTNYLAPRTSENFQISMRLSLEGIGAVLQRDGDYVVIREIVKGGPADLSGALAVGDRITSVAQGVDGELVDVINWRLDDVVDLIRGPKDTIVRLEILPKAAAIGGPSKTITIRRDRVRLEEQAAKSRVLELPTDDGPRRIGVIELPTFYLDFAGRARGEPDYRSTTRDVKRLITDLKGREIDGLVVDLRDNGGGSLIEATELTGLFIKTGPVVQIKGQGRSDIEVQADHDPNVAWAGPMAVLVNRSSASASEIFAAAIQDYGRGLIIGQQTFGKGTVQNLIDLEDLTRGEQAQLGQLKVTIAQYFRIDGGSTQLRGVTPDIALPSALDLDQFGESALPNALPWYSIAPTRYRVYGDLNMHLAMLRDRHATRLRSDPPLRDLAAEFDAIRALNAEREISLNFSLREQQMKAEKERADKAGRIFQTATDSDAESDSADEDQPSQGEKDQDLLLTETARILLDLIELSGAVDLRTADTQRAAVGG